MRKRIDVKTGTTAYPIFVQRGGMESGPAFAALEKLAAGRPCLMVSDERVAPLYLETRAALLRRAGARPVHRATFPAGEGSKTLSTVETLCRDAVRAGLDRQSLIAALGGGVVGDVAGFAAAVYMRGIRVLQMPTTLLAMVDSSVGGKTAVDLPEGKNLVGAFHHPALVLADLETLATLPLRQIRCGLGEVIKYGMILDREFFEFLEFHGPRLAAPDAAVLPEIVAHCCRLKARIVEEDERETEGRREILNFGHTFAHALETLGGYAAFTHGEAVAVGMLMACALAESTGLCGPEPGRRLLALLRAVGLPVRASLAHVPVDRVVAAMYSDKKVRDGRLRLVLPEALGRVRVVPFEDSEALARAVSRFYAPA